MTTVVEGGWRVSNSPEDPNSTLRSVEFVCGHQHTQMDRETSHEAVDDRDWELVSVARCFQRNAQNGEDNGTQREDE